MNWKWPDARGWIGLGAFVLVVIVLALLKFDAALRESEFFKTIATLIVGAFIKDVVGWAYSSTKSGTELAQSQSRIIETNSTNAATEELK